MTLVAEHTEIDTRERILVVAERLFRQGCVYDFYSYRNISYQFFAVFDPGSTKNPMITK